MPALDTRIKAAKVRTLFAFTTFIMSQLVELYADPGRKFHTMVRSTCCWCLDAALSAWSLSPNVIMPRSTVQHTVWLCRMHSATYEWLALQSLSSQKLLFKVRPKTHYFAHMVDHFSETQLCLQHLSCFSDEDFMGKIRRLCQASHGKTYMVSWAKRYALKRALQWRVMRENAEGVSGAMRFTHRLHSYMAFNYRRFSFGAVCCMGERERYIYIYRGT